MAENLVDGETARRLLGEPGPPIKQTMFSAIKKAMGISGQRRILVSAMRTWWKENPNFRMRDAYPPREQKS